MRHDISEKRWNEYKIKNPLDPCTHHIASRCSCNGDCQCHYVWCGDDSCRTCTQAKITDEGLVERQCGKNDADTLRWNWCKDFQKKPCPHTVVEMLYTTFTEHGLQTVMKCKRCGVHQIAQGYVIANENYSIVGK